LKDRYTTIFLREKKVNSYNLRTTQKVADQPSRTIH